MPYKVLIIDDQEDFLQNLVAFSQPAGGERYGRGAKYRVHRLVGSNRGAGSNYQGSAGCSFAGYLFW